jgi:PadR family transcriptional regulator, regulatory protein PadR
MAIESLGSFEELVLFGVLRVEPSDDGAYGMAVRRELEAVGGREVAIGAVYATLDRLEAKGLAASSRGREAAARRLFTVTAAGRRALAETRAARERLWHGVDVAPLRPRRA